MSKIPPELEAEMTPAVKAAFLALLERVEQLTKQVESLTEQVEKLTPRNSSLPPSAERPVRHGDALLSASLSALWWGAPDR
jgi:transposase